MELREYKITDGARCVGRLTLRRDGLYTLIEAKAKPRGELTRLYICGGGESACLGLMMPEGGIVKLRRRLSRLELQSLPEKIELVSTCPPEALPKKRPPASKRKQETQPSAPAENWRPLPDGSLVLSTAEGEFIALPAKLRRVPPGIRLYVINEQEYLVFRY